MKRAFILMLAVGISLALVGSAAAQANKVTVTGSTVTTFGPTVPVAILSTSVKTSTNADLILSFTAECDAFLSDFDSGSLSVFASSFQSTFLSGSSATSFEFDSAQAQVRVWVEVDGTAVRVDPADLIDDGKVTLCRKTNADSDSQNMFLGVSSFATGGFGAAVRTDVQINTSFAESTFDASAQANGFNWYAKNVGQGTHTVNVMAEILTGFSSGGTFGISTPPFGSAAVGKRTLVIEPVNPQK